MPSQSTMKGNISQLQEMGFTEAAAQKALAACVWDVNQALDWLVSRAGCIEDLDVPQVGTACAREVSPTKLPGRTDALAWPVSRGFAGSAVVSDSNENSTTASAVSSPRSFGAVDGAWAVRRQAVPEDVSPPVSEASPALEEVSEALVELSETPNRRLERVQCVWAWGANMEVQFSVKRGQFVQVWAGSATEHGWVFAEDLDGEQGWIPQGALAQLNGQRWMRVVQNMEAVHATQLTVRSGDMLRVHVDSRTEEGWVYAEVDAMDAEEKQGNDASETAQCNLEAGWVPLFCFEWSE